MLYSSHLVLWILIVRVGMDKHMPDVRFPDAQGVFEARGKSVGFGYGKGSRHVAVEAQKRFAPKAAHRQFVHPSQVREIW